MFSGKFIKKDGKIVYDSPKDKLSYEIFIGKLKEGQKVEMYIDLASSDKSTAQLAKVHACIRELAKESGTTFKEMKNIIKKEAGFEDKSFADCSKDELMFAIEACIDLGKNYFNLNLH
jgi:hypothetical protein